MAYVYRHIRHDTNTPFYIGIGTGDNYRSATRTHSRNRFWKSVVAKTTYCVEILFDDVSFSLAKEKEIEFISLYGRRDLGSGSLVNLTDGGQGTVNYSHPCEVREKIRNAHKGMKKPWLKGRDGWGKGRKMSESEKAKLRKPHKKLTFTEARVLSDIAKSKPVQVFKDGGLVAEYVSIKRASDVMGIGYGGIHNVVHGKQAAAKGYVFKFKP